MPPSTAAERAPPGLALPVSMVLLSAAIWPLMDGIAKHLVTSGVPAVQVAWGRYAANVLLLAPVAAARLGRKALLPRAAPAHLLRAALPGLVTALLFVGLGHMPFAAASAVLFANPLITVALSALVLGEHVGPRRWAAVAAGFGGALLVIRPGAALFQWASLAPLGAAVCFSVTAILNRRLAGQASPLATTLHYAVAATVVLLPGAALGWQRFDATLVAWLALSSVFGSLSLWLVTVASERADASVLAPFHFAELGAAAVVGWIAFGEVPGGATLAGIVVILGAGLLATWRGGRP
jgi:drug/metabolite transporter (DMT)-like permease